MADFRVSLEELLMWCRKVDPTAVAQRLLFFEAEESGWIHYVPRLLVMFEGSCEISYRENGERITRIVAAPAVFFCARSGRLASSGIDHIPSRTLSFSYYPDYIRAMMIDFDGVHTPPTARDAFYHTAEPLSAPGWKLLELLDALHDARDDETACALLPILYGLTVRDLEASSAAPVIKVRKLWDEINTFLREHRNEKITRGEVAKLFRVSAPYVSELCKKYADTGFSQLKLGYQLEHARNLLLHTRLSLDEIAEQSGFSCANYLIRRFKQVYGATPHVYRNRPPEQKRSLQRQATSCRIAPRERGGLYGL